MKRKGVKNEKIHKWSNQANLMDKVGLLVLGLLLVLRLQLPATVYSDPLHFVLLHSL